MMRCYSNVDLKRHNQAKIIKKSVILFWLLNMTIRCKHVHRLELRNFFIFCVAHLPVERDINSNVPSMHVQNKKYLNFVFISSLTGKCATQNFLKIRSSSLWTCLHHMVLLRSQNRIKNFLMISA